MKFTFAPESRPLEGYTLKRGIARGGFGEVYYGLSDAGKEVAIKLLQQNMEVELRGIQHCLNLRHPNLVAIYDVKTDADQDHWVIMEYIGGDTLEQVLLKQRGPLPLDQIECWMRGVESGLAFLHDRGIVHRDVKPGNIFWDDGSIKIGDVGLSKFMTPSRRSAHTESVGTVYYMAPEVTYGKYGYEVDIYSCGVMLYEMLTGRLPFDGQSTGEILMKHLSEAPDLTVVPVPFRAVLEGALRKDPKSRTATITRLFQEFEAAVRGHALPTAVREPHTATPSGFASPIAGLQPPIPISSPPNSIGPQGAPTRLAGSVAAAVAPAPFPFAKSAPARVSPGVTVPSAAVSQAEADNPLFDWWLHRVACAAGLLWLAFAIFGSPAQLGQLSFAMWPIVFVCLRFEPVQGSGLSWLWRGDDKRTGDLVYSPTWWARRLAVLGFMCLTTVAWFCGPQPGGPQLTQNSTFALAVLALIYAAYQLLRPSAHEQRRIAFGNPEAAGTFRWQLSDYADRMVYCLRDWDQTLSGFWVQRLAIFIWAQIIVGVVSAPFYGGRGEALLFLMSMALLPFYVLSWMLIRPDKNPLLLRNWFSPRTRSTTPTSSRLSPTTGPSANSATAEFKRPGAIPPLPQKSKPRGSGLGYSPLTIRQISGRQRLADLTVSMSWAVVLTLLFAVGTGFLSPLFGVPSSLHPDPAKLGLFTITTLLAVWALLIGGKLVEGRSTFSRPRRILSFGIGVGIGACAWWLSQILMVELSSEHLRQQAAFVTLGRQPLVINSSPTCLSFLVFFGLLFGLRRWWWHTDAFRPVVFRISSVVLTVALASVLPVIFAFPWDWAVTWAAVISCVAQLSAVWIPPENRSASL